MIYADRHGSGAVQVVWLHGFAGGHWTFGGLARELGRMWRSYCLDLPGHGLTTARPPSFGGVTGALDAWADDGGVRDAHLLGYSFGGRIALSWALANPSRWRSLTLVSANPGIGNSAERSARAVSDGEMADRLVAGGLERFLEFWDRLPLFGPDVQKPESDPRLRYHDRESLAWALRTLSTGLQPDCWGRLGELRMPVCLVTGEHDRTYVEMAERFTAHCPCAVHYPVPGAWHRVHEDRPGEFREIIEEFWSKTDRQRRKTDESACA